MKKQHIGLVFLLDVCAVLFSFFVLAYYRDGTRTIVRDYTRPLIGFILIWTVVSLAGSKYHIRIKKSWSELVASIAKVNFVSFSIVLMLFFFLKMFYYSRFIVFGTIFLTTVIEMVLFIAIYYSFEYRKTNGSHISGKLITKSSHLEKQQAGRFYLLDEVKDVCEGKLYTPHFSDFESSDAIIVKLWGRYLSEQPDLFEFVNDSIALTSFGGSKTLILNSSNVFNIDHVDEQSQHLFINLHKINDLRRVNKYFIKVNENLQQGGVFVCCGETTAQRHRRIIRRGGVVFGNIFYVFDFFFRRVCPKLMLFQGLYFFVTKGRNRSLSETEILGRLYFCGFEVISFKEIDNITYFVVKKVKEPCLDESPSYGPFIKLKRVGKGGKIFNVYKIRTMHPYSEYLQEYVFKKCKVSESGKFADDFRITRWGKIMRNYWIDELPQFYNLLKGDLSLIGTRALSQHYFAQYPEDLQKLRLQFKPGLIPVYTADKSTTLVELIDSERQYLLKKQAGGLMVDVKYFTKAIYNILTRQAKSLDAYN